MAFNTMLIIFFYFFQNFITEVNSLPPDRCFQNFRWDDCGKPATAVIYYYKSGSRCEVGLWRGCLPNHNMFENEYECVATCIFTMRAMPADYHNLIDQYPDYNIITDTEPALDTTTVSSNGSMSTPTNGTDTIIDEEGTNGTNTTMPEGGSTTGEPSEDKENGASTPGGEEGKTEGGDEEKKEGEEEEKPDEEKPEDEKEADDGRKKFRKKH